MSNVKVITDSASDILLSEAQEWGIEVLPFTVAIDGVEYRSGIDITPSEFIAKLKVCKKIPTTSQVTPDAFMQAFKKYTDEGLQILYISLSSKASGTYNNAMIAKQTIEEENPNAVIEVIDTGKFAYIYARAAILAAEMAKGGKDIKTIRQAVIDFLESYEVYVAAQSLTYLEKGGRINKASLVIGNVLDIRPLLSIRNGLIESIGSIRGSKKIVNKLFKKIVEAGQPKAEKEMIIVHCDMEEEAKEMEQLLLNEYPGASILIREVGPTIATHVGPVIAVFFAIK